MQFKYQLSPPQIKTNLKLKGKKNKQVARQALGVSYVYTYIQNNYSSEFLSATYSDSLTHPSTMRIGLSVKNHFFI